MTVVSLFDAVAESSGGLDAHTEGVLARFVGRLVTDVLADLDQLAEYERDFVTQSREASQELEVRRRVWQVYAEWAQRAQSVLDRARSYAGKDLAAEIDQLDRAIGRVQARLMVTPEQTARAIEDARQGRVIPAKELRDELRARLRA